LYKIHSQLVIRQKNRFLQDLDKISAYFYVFYFVFC